MRKRLILALAGALLLAAAIPAGYTGFASSPAASFPEQGDTAFVERVIDGDTIEIEGGEHVRFLGIDTPERGQHFFQESTDFLRGMIEGKDVLLVKDTTERDKYDRLLRYVYLDGNLVNAELLRKGYASTLFYEPDTRHMELFQDLESSAREAGLGIWVFPEGDYCLGIHSFHYNARGDDNENLNGEKVEFRNKCFSPIILGGWRLEDSAGASYAFPEMELENKTTVTVHTGSGDDTPSDLHWGMERAVWNNDGDTLRVWDSDGNLVLEYSY